MNYVSRAERPEEAPDPALRARLEAAADPAYRAFMLPLIPGETDYLGVRVPILQKTAREIARGDAVAFLARPPGTSHEEVLLRGLVIAAGRFSLAEKKARILEYLPLIRNWAICDSFCAALKFSPDEKRDFWQELRPLFHAERPFDVRFAYVLSLFSYLDRAYIPEIAEKLLYFTHPHRYAQTAAAWCLQALFAKDRETGTAVLQDPRLDPAVRAGALRKIAESRKTGAEERERLRRIGREFAPRNGSKHGS